MKLVNNMVVFAMPVAVLAACADSGANYSPIVDGPKNAAFDSDLASCQALAKAQYEGETAGASMIGAGIGGVAGLAEDDDVVGGLVVGALAGAAAGAVETSDKRQAIVIECMRGRGHAVVG